jgi:ABC-2 type transport system ATP-binding protein
VSAVIETAGLGKRYGRLWALSDFTLSIPAGHVVALVGPNGAGKTTRLQLAIGLLEPTAGTIRGLGGHPGESAKQLARVGFVAQVPPVYSRLSVAEHLQIGAWLNPSWDGDLAQHRIEDVGLDPNQPAGKLSGGQRAQLALTLAFAKRPELLLLDEPVPGLDPLARREFLALLMHGVAEHELSVVLSSHLLGDLEPVCDYLIVLVSSRVQVAGAVEELLATHHRFVGPRRDPSALPADHEVIEASNTERQSTFIVRHEGPIIDPAPSAGELNLEDLVLAYMGRAADAERARRPDLGVVR